jgi:4-hydroxy-tetrahydrodipicolinate synthase
MAAQPFAGVLVPVLTPFTPAGEPDAGRFVAFCRWLLDQGADGLAIFGTTSEANSMSAGERMALLDRLIASGVPAARLMPGAGACSVTEAATLIRHAVGHGCGGVLMLPPFYYKGMDDNGLYAFFAGVIDRVGSSALRMFLYHIPPQTVLGLSLDLVARLIKAYPETVVGLKDSSGDWNNTAAMLAEFAPQGFDVFCGSENYLLATMRGGGAGCITATGNVNPAAIVQLYKTWQKDGAEDRQKGLDATRAVFAQYPMIPAMKAAIAWKSGREDWRTVRPPLVELSRGEANALEASLGKVGFDIPNAAKLA